MNTKLVLWLKIIAVLICLSGVLFFIAALLNNHLSIITDFFFGPEPVSGEAHRFIVYMYGEYSAAALAFGVFVWFLASRGIRRNLQWARQALITGAGLWTALVVVANIISGVPVIAAANAVLGALLIIPAVLMPAEKPVE